LTGDLEIDWTVGMLDREQALQIWASIPGVIQAITRFGPHLFDILLPVNPLVHRLAPYLTGSTDWFDQLQAFPNAEPPVGKRLEQAPVLEELTRVFRTLSGHNPLLLILDDLQWADGASLNLLFHLGKRLAGSRILLLGSYRTGENIANPAAAQADADRTNTPENLLLELARQYGDIQIRLDQASPSEARAFVDAIVDLEPNHLEEAFRKDLYLHTRGHPLFTVEILHSLRQNQNILLDEAGYWVENKSAPPAPPPARVEAILEQRLRRLNPAQRELLDIASVEGEGFTVEMVANVLGLDPASALKICTHDLQGQHHLILEQGQLHVRSLSLNRFQFRHVLIQDYLYNQLNPAEKRRLHGRMAQEMERTLFEQGDMPVSTPASVLKSGQERQVETLDTFGPALLRHFWLGQEWARAAVYAQQLGIRARQRYAMREAIAYYEQALESLGNQAESQDDLILEVLLGWQEAAFNFRPYARTKCA
jgi:predicted ATPase